MEKCISVPHLFPFSIFIVHVRQDEVNPAHTVPEKHRVFTLRVLINLGDGKTDQASTCPPIKDDYARSQDGP